MKRRAHKLRDAWPSHIPASRLAPLLEEHIRQTFGGLGRTTVLRHRICLDRLLRFCAGKVVDSHTLNLWVADRSTTCCPATMKKERQTLSRFFNWCLAEGVVLRSPLVGVNFPANPQETPPPFSAGDYQKVMAAHGEDDIGWLTMLGWNTGLSLVDAANLRVDEVDLEHWFIEKRRQKTKVPCRIPIDPESPFARRLEALVKLRSETPKEWIDQSRQCRFICPWAAERMLHERKLSTGGILNKAYKKLGITMTYRHLRNAYCSMLANAGIPDVVAMRMTGHKKHEQYHRYVTVGDDTLAEHGVAALRRRTMEGRV